MPKATIDIENFTYKEPAKQVNIYGLVNRLLYSDYCSDCGIGISLKKKA